ncbi:MAG TPA: PKD domain-containing protein [Flavisolibacter sp.]|nr:PKD domain-containing protein [Flavisolibacter sp.]
MFKLTSALRPLIGMLSTSVLLFSSLKGGAQAYNNWFFGDGAAVSFNPAGPLVPQAISGSAMVADEGTASISNSNGQLLFYTDGSVIYNRNHQVMLNGDNLQGNASAFQSPVIIPFPGHDSLYYVFTADAKENAFANGYRYSVINMNRDNGLGEVVSKNVLLSGSGTERITAARHANGIDIWIITNDGGSNIFRAWLLSCNGLSTVPVVSAVGEILNEFELQKIGMLKISPDGEKLCQTHFPRGSLLLNHFFQLFDFNNSTGQLSNPKKITLPEVNVYACEFSPDSKLLYLTSVSNFLEQVEAKLPTAAAIEASWVSIPSDYGFYGIQLGPDSKIYLTQSDSMLSVINRPNEKGQGCLLQLDQIDLGGKKSKLSLPFVLHDIQGGQNGFSFTIIDTCAGIVQFNGETSLQGPLQWAWDFGDGNSSTEQNPLHTYASTTQAYQVKLEIISPSLCGTIRKSSFISFTSGAANPGFDHVVRCDSAYVRFVNTTPYSNAADFIWSFGDGTFSSEPNPVHSYALPGDYEVKLTVLSAGACATNSITKTVRVEVLDIEAQPAAVTIWEGQPVQLSLSGAGNSKITWSPAAGLSARNIANPIALPNDSITYYVMAENNLGCVDYDSVRINVIPIPEIHVPTAFTPDGDGLNEIFKPFASGRFTLNRFSVFTRWGERIFTTSQK